MRIALWCLWFVCLFTPVYAMALQADVNVFRSRSAVTPLNVFILTLVCCSVPLYYLTRDTRLWFLRMVLTAFLAAFLLLTIATYSFVADGMSGIP